MDSSRELASIYAISFVINLYLIFLIGVKTSDMIGLKINPVDLNGPKSLAIRPFYMLHSFAGKKRTRIPSRLTR
jgi:hypothetical protein